MADEWEDHGGVEVRVNNDEPNWIQWDVLLPGLCHAYQKRSEAARAGARELRRAADLMDALAVHEQQKEN